MDNIHNNNKKVCWHADFQNSRKSSTSKLKIQVPQVLASSVVSKYESSTKKKMQGIQEFKYCCPIIATGATVNIKQTQTILIKEIEHRGTKPFTTLEPGCLIGKRIR